MVREIDPPTIQKEFLLAALSEGKRLDGRLPLQMRDVEYIFGEELGCVECRLGKTAVLAQVSATVVKPRDDRPYEGTLVINSEIGPMASSIYENGRPSDDEVLITRLLEKSIRRTEAIDRESLCIIAGEKVWQIRLALHFLSDSGNLLDCASLASMAALKHFRKPDVEVSGDEVTIHNPDDRAPVSLTIHHVPLCLTYAYFENLSPILDPSHLEETLCSGTLTVTLNPQREICVLSKAGGSPLSAEDIMSVVKGGVDKVRALSKSMEEALEKDQKKRIIESTTRCIVLGAVLGIRTMNRIFRTRTASSSEKRRKSKPKDEEWDVSPKPERAELRRVDGTPPSLDVDIRNSLILPSLSLRFSVLLPSLSAAPEESLRSLLASQRARPNGPALTKEEEELLITELRESGPEDNETTPLRIPIESKPSYTRYGSLVNNQATFNRSPPLPPSSVPSPALSEKGQNSNSLKTFSSPTFTSFSSFKSVDANSSPKQPGTNTFKRENMSYGISGGSSLREENYMRRAREKIGAKNLEDPTVKKNADSKTTESRQKDEGNIPVKIFPEKANTYYMDQRPRISNSPTSSEKSTTPTPTALPLALPHPLPSASFQTVDRDLDSSSSAINIDQKRRKQRKSLLLNLTPAQAKRISLALEEIGGELRRGGSLIRKEGFTVEQKNTENEEVLASEENRGNSFKKQGGKEQGPTEITFEEGPVLSATSSVFPFKMSPINSTFDVSTNIFASTISETPSPSRLPSSPHSHNLQAYDDQSVSPIPKPIFTPTRSQADAQRKHTPSDVSKHNSSISNASSTSISTPTQVQHNPAYVPGQPRPIRSAHHSEESQSSSRAATPNGQPPSDAFRVSKSTTSQNQSPLDAVKSLTIYRDTIQSMNASPSHFQSRSIGGAKFAVLARSKSVNQTVTPTMLESPLASAFSRRRAGTVASGESISDGRRLNSPLGLHTTLQEDIVEEDENVEGNGEDVYFENSSHHRDCNNSTPELRQFKGRHSVAASRQDSEVSVSGQRWYHSQDSDSWMREETLGRAISAQETIRTEPDASGSSYRSPLSTPQQRYSTDSLDSCFEPEPQEIQWIDILSSSGSLGMITDASEDQLELDPEEVLREISGMGTQELATLQEKLVAKAKMEREAMGLSDSSMIPITPATPIESSSPGSQRSVSPKFSSPLRNQQLSAMTAVDRSDPVAIFTTPHEVRSRHSSPNEQNDHTTATEPTVQLSFKPAPLAIHPPQPLTCVTLEETNSFENMNDDMHGIPSRGDPEAEREKDFRIRIAAATAALNRNTSIQDTRLERKGTRSSTAKVISGPKLLSSTTNVSLVPLSPDRSVDTTVTRSQSSGSSNKMSQRWKRLMKKGPSLSNSDIVKPVVPNAPTPQSALLEHPKQQLMMASALLQRANSQKVANALETPIHLTEKEVNKSEIAPPSAPSNLDMYRFPPQDENDLKRVKDPATALSESATTIPTPPNTGGISNFPQSVTSRHCRAATQDSAVHKFLQAGRELGLTEEQLQEMLVQKGMITSNDIATTPCLDEIERVELDPIHPSPVSPVTQQEPLPIVQTPEKKKGLFRSLSKKAKELPSRVRMPEESQSGIVISAPASQASQSTRDKVIVRRTMILPDGLIIVPSTPQQVEKPLGSPDSSPFARQPSQRKPSVRRKPLNLSKEDRELVSNSPPAHQHRFSINANSNHKLSTSTGDEGHGSEFLYPGSALVNGDFSRTGSNVSGSASGRSFSGKSQQSSAGGSLIDMYGDDYDDGHEILQASPKSKQQLANGEERTSINQRRSIQGVEICEYADGQVVWSIVDALRTSAAGSADEESQFGRRRSRSSSYSSTRRDSALMPEKGDFINDTWSRPSLTKGIGALNLRHKDRHSVAKPRPPTDVYLTSSRDVADLIDHLSRDLEASRGRIDIIPSRRSITETEITLPLHKYVIDEQFSPNSPSGNSQFEDAPSPAALPQRPSLFNKNVSHNSPLDTVGNLLPQRRLSLKYRPAPKIGQAGFTFFAGDSAAVSPSANSFTSSESEPTNKTVEERLQELMDKMGMPGAEK
ncbi:uncharacterized protein L203_105013 [Cryptococcus depauperatus CBS 7841]|uniref:Exosome complex component RRP45 n=1 Tax=Cryptococcus depauperatus CBS 7841 TaxID=1295531 RepID=A0AAJ8JWJ9_9TREE